MCLLRACAAAIAASVVVISVTTTASGGGGPPPPHGQATTSAGKILVDARGMTLYVFDGDGRYRPNCLGECAATWKPFQDRRFPIEPYQGRWGEYWSIIGRSDGLEQWAYGGRPLYYYSGDLKPGDTGGDHAEGGVWHVARVLCLPVDANGETDETEAIAVVDAALESGISPLTELRRYCGFELADLAERSGIELPDLLSYEAGRKELSKAEIAAIANVLGIPIFLLLE